MTKYVRFEEPKFDNIVWLGIPFSMVCGLFFFLFNREAPVQERG